MPVIAVHGGAGYHKPAQEKELKRGLRLACRKAVQLGAESSLLLVETAISSLEDDPSFNAGLGSNLTLDGTVECDAAIMNSEGGAFGSVGAVSGVKNPIRLARAILDYSQVPDPLSRIPPLTLASAGAVKFATRHAPHVDIVASESLVTSEARKRWNYWRERLEKELDPDEQGLHDIQDTVGAVAWTGSENIAAGVSSGGLLLKHPGRVGEAALFGAGCWAQNNPIMACSISGAGELITRYAMAKSLSEEFAVDEPDVHQILQRTLQTELQGQRAADVGVLLLTVDRESRARLWCAFTTPSMAIAYWSPDSTPKPTALVLRRNIRSSDSSQLYITAIPL